MHNRYSPRATTRAANAHKEDDDIPPLQEFDDDDDEEERNFDLLHKESNTWLILVRVPPLSVVMNAVKLFVSV